MSFGIGLILLAAAVIYPVFADALVNAGADVNSDIVAGVSTPPMFPAPFSGKIWVAEIEIDAEKTPRGVFIDGVIPKTPALYGADIVERTVRAVSRLLSDNGYPYNKIAAFVESDEADSSIISIRLIVDADERACNGPAVIAGVSGRRDIYMRDVRIVPGRPYSAADADETARRLSARPYVREAFAGSPVIIEDGVCEDAGTPSHDRDVGVPAIMAVTPIMITENRGAAAEGALGYRSGRGDDKGAMNGRVDLSFINMFRRGEIMGVSYTGTSVTQKLALSGSKPWVFGLPLEAGGALGLEVEDGNADGNGGYGFLSGEIWGAAEIDARYRIGAALNVSETAPSSTLSGGLNGNGSGMDKGGAPYQFYGADIFVSLITGPWEKGLTIWEFEARTGGGMARRERSYNRNKAELTLGLHKAFTSLAVAGRIRAMALFTDEERLSAAEMYRVGGHGSLRGYSEDEFAFRSAAYAQAEALYYFNRRGSLYIFTDIGAGFDSPGQISLSSAARMFGYGLGTRFPSRLGTVSLEWARNVDDEWNLGRLHVGLRRYM